ncbi:MAG: hypothetical protein M0Q22_04855 [Sulfuritalea sp.]|jgi:hypothetical protein|nr:hypothetical protein [Sulfuritalea sp.]
MDTSRIEALLETLIDKQDEIITRIEALEQSVSYDLGAATSELSTLNTNLNSGLSQIHDELNWWGEGHSFAKQVLAALEILNMNTTG